jgi:hypothetical protein
MQEVADLKPLPYRATLPAVISTVPNPERFAARQGEESTRDGGGLSSQAWPVRGEEMARHASMERLWFLPAVWLVGGAVVCER